MKDYKLVFSCKETEKGVSFIFNNTIGNVKDIDKWLMVRFYYMIEEHLYDPIDDVLLQGIETSLSKIMKGDYRVMYDYDGRFFDIYRKEVKPKIEYVEV